MLQTHHFPVPIIIIGNITVGGTGKTPFVIWLTNFLKAQGYQPGIVSRGYGGKQQQKPRTVKLNDHAEEVGDETLLLVKNTRCPVVTCTDRAEAVHALLNTTNCNVVISDDGLQHYCLARDIEIALLDGERRLGNQCLLPAGPLREPASRLNEVDLVVVKDGLMSDVWSFNVAPTQFVSLTQANVVASLNTFKNKKVHAVAGIANPEKFFSMLKQMDIDMVPHTFPDHYIFQANDLTFNDDLPIIMTEKDAVKCSKLANDNSWYLAVNVSVNDNLQQKLITLIAAASQKKQLGESNEIKSTFN